MAGNSRPRLHLRVESTYGRSAVAEVHLHNYSSVHLRGGGGGGVSVVVQFCLWFNFVFLCFGVWLCMIMSLEQREIKIKPRPKLYHNIYIQEVLVSRAWTVKKGISVCTDFT